MIPIEPILKKIFKDDKVPYKTFEGERVINFDNINEKIGVLIFVIYDNKILLVKRSENVDYSGLWHPVSGYYDKLVSPEVIINKELSEEVSITQEDIESIQDLEVTEMKGGKDLWYMFPFIVSLVKKTEIKLNYENDDFGFFNLDELKDLKMIPNIYDYIISQIASRM